MTCAPSPPSTATPAWGAYKWQTTLRLPAGQRAQLDSLPCHTLYIKYADLAPDESSGQPVPYAVLQPTDTTGIHRYAVVPVVFLVNQMFKNAPTDAALDTLARKTARLVRRVHAQMVTGEPEEVQLDCDWTPSTRAAYFAFLQKMQSQFPQSQLSATVRLHQYHDPDRTGVPPVARGMLMLYHTGEVDAWDSPTPALFSTTDAQPYLRAKRAYPLPLDVALPAFSWALVYRGGALWKIIADPDPQWFTDTARFAPEGNGRYRVQRGTFVAEQYLRPDDRVRVERADATTLQQAMSLARSVPNVRRWVLYHAEGISRGF